MADIKWVSRRGNTVNEDDAWASDVAGYVLDGASGLYNLNVTPERSDAMWFSHSVGRHLKQYLYSEKTLTELLHDCCAICMKEYYGFVGENPICDNALPSASVAIYRRMGEYIEFYLLGDCVVVIELHEKATMRICDETLTLLDKSVVEFMEKRSKEKGVGLPHVFTDALPLLQKNRNLKNTIGGYWTLDPTGKGVDHGNKLTLNINDVRSFVLMSDGFYTALTFPGLYSCTQDFMSALETCSIEEIATNIHAALEQDAMFIRYPRLKLKDDASAVWYKP